MVNIKVKEDLELLPFQVKGVSQMLEMHRSNQNILLGDEMRLGKTIEILSFINEVNREPILNHGPFKKVLIICPNNLKYNWYHESQKWLEHSYDMEVAGSTIFMFGDFVIINYEALRNFQDALGTIEWDLIVADEAHKLKNPSAQRSKIVYSMFKAKRWVFATGTPIINYPNEIFPLIHHLDSESWPHYSGFEYGFVNSNNDKYGRNLEHLNRILRYGSNGEMVKDNYGRTIYRYPVKPVMIRRLKKEVLTDLPTKRRQVIELPNESVKEIISREKELYNNQAKDFMDELNAMLSEAVDGSKEGMTDADFEAIIETLKANKRFAFEEMAKIRHILGKAKVHFVQEHLEDCLEEEDKVIVFGHHHEVLRAIYEKAFREDPKVKLFVGSMSTEGEGISLAPATHCIFAEADWVPGKLTQAEDRMFLMGNDIDSFLIQHMVFEDSMDSVMMKRVIRKQKSIGRAVGI